MNTFAEYTVKVFVLELKDKHYKSLFQGMDEKKFDLPNNSTGTWKSIKRFFNRRQQRLYINNIVAQTLRLLYIFLLYASESVYINSSCFKISEMSKYRGRIIIANLSKRDENQSKREHLIFLTNCVKVP